MATDLTRVSDHPAKVLQADAKWYVEQAALRVVGDDLGEIYQAVAGSRLSAATVLSQYEVEHQVTFAALDRATLKELQEVYSQIDAIDDVHRMDRFISLTSLLLGLED